MSNNPHFKSPKHWRDRAEEARVLATQMRNDFSKKMMLGLAEDYDKLALRASLRIESQEVGHKGLGALIRRSIG